MIVSDLSPVSPTSRLKSSLLTHYMTSDHQRDKQTENIAQETYSFWRSTIGFLAHERTHINILIVGFAPKDRPPQRLLSDQDWFAYDIDFLEDLDAEQLDLFDVILLRPFSLCRQLSSLHYCWGQQDALFEFMKGSLMHSVLVLPGSLTPLHLQYKHFLGDFLSILTGLRVRPSAMIGGNLMLLNCINSSFDKTDLTFSSISKFWKFFGKMDLARFGLDRLLEMSPSARNELRQCVRETPFIFN